MEDKVLANFEDVLKHYSTDKINQQKNALDYIKSNEIRRKHFFGARKISRIIKIPEGTINNWLMGKKKPRAIKGLNQLKSMKLLPLRVEDSEEFKHFMRALGLRYADGCIYKQSRNNSYTFYICFGDKIDAMKFIEDSKIAWNIDLDSKYYPITRAYYVYLPSSLARLMLVVGSVKGNKTGQIFNLPKWIFDLQDSLKIEFLRGIFSGDGDNPRLKPSGKAAESLRLSMSSHENLVEEFRDNFMKDVYKLIKSLGIQATYPEIKYNQPRVSKEGRVTYPVAIRILTNRKNMINFLENIKYTYCNRAIIKGNFVLKALRNID